MQQLGVWVSIPDVVGAFCLDIPQFLAPRSNPDLILAAIRQQLFYHRGAGRQNVVAFQGITATVCTLYPVYVYDLLYVLVSSYLLYLEPYLCLGAWGLGYNMQRG